MPVTDVRIFHYANCSSCRKALTALQASGLEIEERDIFRQRLTANEIRGILTELGQSPHDLLSRRSTPFRELGLAEKTLSEDELIQLMSEHPALIRRPVILGSNEHLIGFSAKALGEMIASIERGKTQ